MQKWGQFIFTSVDRMFIKKDLVAWLNSAAYPNSTQNGDITCQMNNYFMLYKELPVCETPNLGSSFGYVSDF